MALLVIVGLNLLIMAALFAFGFYQFMRIEGKRKSRQLLADSALDEGELRALLQERRYDEARARLMRAADVDRFSAEAALQQLHIR